MGRRPSGVKVRCDWGLVALTVCCAMLWATGFAPTVSAEDAMSRAQARREAYEKAQADKRAQQAQANRERQAKLLAKARDTIDDLHKKIWTGEHRKALGPVMQLRSALGQPRVGDIEGMVAEICRLDKQYTRAWKYVQAWSTKRGQYDWNDFAAHLQAGELLRVRGQLDDALVLLDWLTARESKRANDSGNASVDVVFAAEATGRVLFALKRYKDALAAYQFAGQYARSQLKDYTRDPPLKQLLARINANTKKTQRVIDIERYGEAFVLFRDAERLRLQKDDHGKALPIYRKIIQRWPDSPFADAAGLYEALCLVQMRRYGQAEAKLRAFCEAKPQGMWRGEALLELGRIALERRVDPDRAEERFAELDKWIAAVRKDDKPWNYAQLIPGIKAAAGQLVRPPQQEKMRDRWGNVKFTKMQPGELVNRKTAPWYLDNLEEQCAKFRGFLAFARPGEGNNEAAIAHYKRIPKLDPTITGLGTLATNPNDYHRLMFGPQHGYLVAYPQELKLYKGRQRFAVLLGDFYYITQQFGKATEICDRLLAGEFGRLTGKQQDYVHYLLGSVLYRGKWQAGGNSAKLAIKQWEKVLERQDGTWTEYRSAYVIGNIALMTSNKSLHQRGEAMLASLARSGERNEYTHKAKFALAASWLQSGRTEEALAVLGTLQPQDGPYHQLAQYMIDEIKKDGT
jgi:tetratricopeptide (TPR) repeat protein